MPNLDTSKVGLVIEFTLHGGKFEWCTASEKPESAAHHDKLRATQIRTIGFNDNEFESRHSSACATYIISPFTSPRTSTTTMAMANVDRYYFGDL